MLFRRFLDDSIASVVPLLAIAAIPLTALIGASVDYSRASQIRTSMQAAVDSTALALSQSAATTTATQLATNANTYFGALCMDQREAQLCDNIKSAGIKSAGITIYAIQVDTDGEPTSALLQYCAGSVPKQGNANNFWLLTSPTQITATFNTIGQQISKLHIAK